MTFITRFAPAPTGHLHLGHVVNAIWVWGYARAHDGRVLLRIEDHDRGRCRAEYEASILDDLDWLGFAPDGASTDDFRRGPHAQRQSDNRGRYAAHLVSLETRGLVYPCACSRSDIARALDAADAADAPDAAELRYPGTCRNRGTALAPNIVPARRVRIEPGTAEHFVDLQLGPQDQDPERQCGDVLLRDRNGNFTYQFAVVVDDLEQHVDLVIRGEDLLPSTGRQLRLARLIGRTAPLRFLHHPLVRDENGRKLSKSAGDTGVRELRRSGVTAAEVLGRAAVLGGLPHDGSAISAQELRRLFR